MANTPLLRITFGLLVLEFFVNKQPKKQNHRKPRRHSLKHYTMAPKSNPSTTKLNARRVRKRKARTEVSSSSSSSSENEKSSRSSRNENGVQEANQKSKKVERTPLAKKERRRQKVSEEPAEETEEDDTSADDDTPKPQQESFSSFYLRKVTAELADDLDKVRQSSDFNDRSLPMLVHALKQGESIFGKRLRGL